MTSSTTGVLLRVMSTVFILTSLVLQWVIAWIVQSLYKVFTYPFTTKAERQDACGHIFRFICFVGMDVLNPFWKVTVFNKFPEVRNKKVILMMNHLSAADPFMTMRSLLPRDGTWIAKDDLFRMPFGGWAMANAGDLAVRFSNKKVGFETVKGTVGPMMEDARVKLRRGRMLCVFPEGTRSNHPDGPLQPFRLGFFHLALEEGAVIVPLTISGTEKMWPLGKLMDVANAYFTFGEPVEACDYTSAKAMSQHVWQVLTSLRDSHPNH